MLAVFLSFTNLMFEQTQMLEISKAASTFVGQCIVKNEENVGDIKLTFKNAPNEAEIVLVVIVADMSRTTHSKILIGLGQSNRGARQHEAG